MMQRDNRALNKPDNALSPEEWAKVQERYRGLDLQVPNQDKVLTLKKKISKENKDTKAKKALRP